MSPVGPGKYDELATYALRQSVAEGVIVIVINGRRGTGMAVQASLPLTLTLPAVLRACADDIEASFRAGTV